MTRRHLFLFNRKFTLDIIKEDNKYICSDVEEEKIKGYGDTEGDALLNFSLKILRLIQAQL